MKIEFELADKEKVSIIAIDEKGGRKEVGEIFTPSGSSHTTTNAIQICGFTEAFDLWGCAKFAQTAYTDTFGEGEKRMVPKLVQVKDIQLKFDFDTRLHLEKTELKCCVRCYNHPCTCEVFVKYENPYVVKNHQDLHLEQKKEVV